MQQMHGGRPYHTAGGAFTSGNQTLHCGGVYNSIHLVLNE